MPQQALLLQKEEKSRKTEVKTEKIELKEIEDNILEQKIANWIKQCKENKENFAYFKVTYLARVELDGSKKEAVETSTTVERPFRKPDDSYGGMWGCGGFHKKEDLNELKEDIINWVKDQLSWPYNKEHADGHLISDIKREDVRVFIDDNSKDFIKRNAEWSLKDIAEEIKAIKVPPLTKEYLKKVQRLELLDKEIEKLEYTIIPDIKKKVERILEGDEDSQKTLNEEDDINEIVKTLKENKGKLKVMKREYDALRHELYRW